MKKLLFKLIGILILSLLHIFPAAAQDLIFDGVVKEGDIIYVDPNYPVASSTLQDEPDDYYMDKYNIRNAFDKNIKTAWVEGKKDAGTGEIVAFTVPLDSQYITIINGYGKSDYLFKANNRVKEITLSFHMGVVISYTEWSAVNKTKLYKQEMKFTLKDTVAEQKIPIDIDPVKAAAELKAFKDKIHADNPEYAPYLDRDPVLICIITIKSVYPGTKYNDTCISEIGLK